MVFKVLAALFSAITMFQGNSGYTETPYELVILSQEYRTRNYYARIFPEKFETRELCENKIVAIDTQLAYVNHYIKFSTDPLLYRIVSYRCAFRGDQT